MNKFAKRAFSVAGLLLAGLAGALQSAELIHNPVLSAAAGQDVVIEASLVGAQGDPRIRLYYRPRGKEIFRSLEMSGPASGLSASIPGEAVDVAGLEYYLEASAVLSGKKTVLATSPATNPLLNPHSVTVRKDQSGPEVTVLSPAEGEKLDSSQPVITASFTDADSGVDPASVLIKIDGEAVKDKGNIQAFESLVSYIPGSPLGDGEHEITVVVRDKSGNPGSAKWTVSVNASAGQKAKGAKGGWVVDGRVGYLTEYGHALSQSSTYSPLPYRPYGLNKGTVDVSARSAGDALRLQVSKSDAERSDQQPVDRYTGTYKSRQGVIAVGDYSPSFSELSLYQLNQLRGVTLDLQSGKLDEGHTRMVGVWGQTRRAVEQGAAGLSGGSGATATYAQYLYGARWEFGSPYFQLGLNSVTINDESGSVGSGSLLPRYNYIDTSDVRLGIPQIGLKLTGEYGLDLYTDSTPILGSSLGTAYKAGMDWNIKPWETRFKFDWKDLGGGFGLLPGGYTTAANPGLELDYRGYEGSFSQGLFDGQFSLSLDMNRWRDNLQGVKPAVTTSDFMAVFVNVAPNGLPYIVVGYTQAGQVNDANGDTSGVVSGAAPNYIQDNRTSSLLVNLGYTKDFGAQRTGSLNVSVNTQGFKDQAAKRNSQDLNGYNVVLAGFAGLGASSFNASVGFGNNDAPGVLAVNTAYYTLSPTAATDLQPRVTKSFNASLQWKQAWVRDVFDSSLGYDLSSSSSDSAAFGAIASTGSLISNRSTFTVGSNYRFLPEQKLGLRFSLATAASENRTGTVTVTDNVSQLLTHATYDLEF